MATATCDVIQFIDRDDDAAPALLQLRQRLPPSLSFSLLSPASSACRAISLSNYAHRFVLFFFFPFFLGELERKEDAAARIFLSPNRRTLLCTKRNARIFGFSGWRCAAFYYSILPLLLPDSIFLDALRHLCFVCAGTFGLLR